MGFFITVEGGEFTGKTSVVIPGVADVLKQSGFDVKVSREPGGTPEAEQIRKKIFKRLEEQAPVLELATLFNEARKLHLDQVVHPFLAKHELGVVLSDRYADTMMVLQGMDGGAPIETLLKLHKEYTGNTFPNHTLILHFPKKLFIDTFNRRKTFADKLEGRDKTAWDERIPEDQLILQDYYLYLPILYRKAQIKRSFATIDASGHPYEVIEQSVDAIQKYFKKNKMKQDLLTTFYTLRDNGKWNSLDAIWKEQQS